MPTRPDQACHTNVAPMVSTPADSAVGDGAGIKCRYQFCWECLADYKEIVRTDNSSHGEDCPFHTDNLPQ